MSKGRKGAKEEAQNFKNLAAWREEYLNPKAFDGSKIAHTER